MHLSGLTPWTPPGFDFRINKNPLNSTECPAEVLEGEDPGGRAFALFLHPHPGGFRRLFCPHPGVICSFLKKNAYVRGLARGDEHCWN